MLLPISDDDRGISGPAYVSLALIAANILVFLLFQQGGGNETFTSGYSATPYELTQGVDLTDPTTFMVGSERYEINHTRGPMPIYLTVISSMFMHAGIMHLAGNLLFLWIFGDNIEHRFGHIPFLGLYLAAGIAATIGQVALDPSSIIPSLGASGAISGVMGAYLVLFPKNKVHAIFFFTIVTVPAIVVLGAWIVFQIIDGIGSITGQQIGGVAYGAHIGGFIAGIALALVMKRFIVEKDKTIFTQALSSRKSRRR